MGQDKTVLLVSRQVDFVELGQIGISAKLKQLKDLLEQDRAEAREALGLPDPGPRLRGGEPCRPEWAEHCPQVGQTRANDDQWTGEPSAGSEEEGSSLSAGGGSSQGDSLAAQGGGRAVSNDSQATSC